MYEPLVFKERTVRSLRGTPAGTVTVIVNFSKILIPFGILLYAGYYLSKKKKFIDELNEYDFVKTEKLIAEERMAKQSWLNSNLQPIASKVLHRQHQKEAEKENP